MCAPVRVTVCGDKYTMEIGKGNCKKSSFLLAVTLMGGGGKGNGLSNKEKKTFLIEQKKFSTATELEG